MKSYPNLHNFFQNIERIIEKQNSEQVARNRLQLKVSIDAVKSLVFQACAFNGRDEVQDSRYQVVNKIDKIRRNVLLGSVGGRRKMAKVKWKQICLPKEKEGVATVDFRVKNKLLMAKQS
ncbi:hypothetical protein PVK06_040731 [Gossypium arboreum]|uniref:Uncharacterized protein n=1 Tax=Gossypium arboreum TaxID=29729 RepID=A0ABR0N946_GOSAR|nr:hypothetical protein PVK06_040731 [Gossypium arboreum]